MRDITVEHFPVGARDIDNELGDLVSDVGQRGLELDLEEVLERRPGWKFNMNKKPPRN